MSLSKFGQRYGMAQVIFFEITMWVYPYSIRKVQGPQFLFLLLCSYLTDRRFALFENILTCHYNIFSANVESVYPVKLCRKTINIYGTRQFLSIHHIKRIEQEKKEANKYNRL